jgi:ribosomal-protein-alanine N-acetyltransferase
MTSLAMKLSTRKVFLRLPAASDYDELAALYRKSKKHFAGFANAEYSRAKFDSMLLDSTKETNAAFLICRVEDGAIVGTANLSQIFLKSFQNAYLGYQLFAGFTGQGFMTDAVGLVLLHAFTRLGLHRVEANVQPENKPSIAVLKRCGFTKEGFSRRYLEINGRWRDHERWAILKEDWIKFTADERKRSRSSNDRPARGSKSR